MIPEDVLKTEYHIHNLDELALKLHVYINVFFDYDGVAFVVKL